MAKTILAIFALSALVLAGCTSNTGSGNAVTSDHPAMTGDHTGASFATFHSAFNDHPYKLTGGGDVVTDNHEWLDHDDGTLNFLHWDTTDPSQATKLMFFGDMIGPLKGCMGTGGISQAQYEDGFVHFHKQTSAGWAQGHHPDITKPNLTGYWLRHTDNNGMIQPVLDSQAPAGPGIPPCLP